MIELKAQEFTSAYVSTTLARNMKHSDTCFSLLTFLKGCPCPLRESQRGAARIQTFPNVNISEISGKPSFRVLGRGMLLCFLGESTMLMSSLCIEKNRICNSSYTQLKSVCCVSETGLMLGWQWRRQRQIKLSTLIVLIV